MKTTKLAAATAAVMLLSLGAAEAENAAQPQSDAAAAEGQMAKPVPFEEADADASGSLDADELTSALYTSIDTDGSATIEEREYALGNPIFKEVAIIDADTDGDKVLNDGELDADFVRQAVIERFDGDDDGVISSQEYIAMFEE